MLLKIEDMLLSIKDRPLEFNEKVILRYVGSAIHCTNILPDEHVSYTGEC